MSWTSLLNHIANFFLPSLFLAVGLAVLGSLRGRSNNASPFWPGVLVLLVVGAICQATLLFLGFKDGSIAGYAALVGVVCLTHWLWTWSSHG